MKHFKKIAAILAVAVLFVVLCVAVTATETPTLTIEMKNLKLENNVQIMYAVPVQENVDIVYLEVYSEDAYLNGGVPTILSGTIRTIEEKNYWVFIYTKLAAKQMTDNVYARAYAEVNGETIYSETEKYSILQYAYNKIYDYENTSSKLRNLLDQMLYYGAYSQRYFDYKTNRLASGSFSQITVVGGTLYDGFTEGLFCRGESVTLYAPETNEAGETFTGWIDSDGRKLKENAVTVSWDDEEYTAVYGETWGESAYSEGLEYSLSADGTYYCVVDRGLCTDTDVKIPPIYEGLPVKEISSYAFWWESDITSIWIPNSITYIAERAFSGCSALVSMALEDGNEAYCVAENCLIETATKTLLVGFGECTIPNDGSVEIIGKAAFYGNESLTDIKLPSSITTIRWNAFARSSLASIEIPESVTCIEGGVFECCQYLESIAVAENNSVYRCVNGCLVDIGNNMLIAMLPNGVIPSDGSVEFLEYGIFTNPSAITGIKIPNGVKTIGEDFGNCYNLTSIDIPQSVIYIDFLNAYSLTDVYYAGTKAEWGSISYSGNNERYTVHCSDGDIDAELLLFGKVWNYDSMCNDLYLREINDIQQYSVAFIEVPATYDGLSVVGIGDYAFGNCYNLCEVSLPNSLTYIESGAFYWCTNLTSIQFAGTTAEWVAIQKDDGWDADTGEYTIYCTDGTIAKDGTVTPNT